MWEGHEHNVQASNSNITVKTDISPKFPYEFDFSLLHLQYHISLRISKVVDSNRIRLLELHTNPEVLALSVEPSKDDPSLCISVTSLILTLGLAYP